MRQSSYRVRDKFQADGTDGTQKAIDILRNAGASVTDGWIAVVPLPPDTPSEVVMDVADALEYLLAGWDYQLGHPPTVTAAPPVDAVDTNASVAVVSVVAGAIIHDMWTFIGTEAHVKAQATSKFYELCDVNDALWGRRSLDERKQAVADGYYQIQTDRAICLTSPNVEYLHGSVKAQEVQEAQA